MEPKDKDLLHQLFAGMPDETLPLYFNEKVMGKIRKEAVSRVIKRKYKEIFGYVAGGIVMLTIYALILFFFDISIELPTIDLHNWSFPRPDYELFKSQPFYISVFIGIVALFLLIVDSSIRRYIEKNK